MDMLDKQEFMDGLEKNLASLLPSEYLGAQITFRDVHSSRGTYCGANVRIPGNTSIMTPVLNVDAMYEKVQDMDITSALNYTSSVYGEFLKHNDIVKRDPDIMDRVHGLTDYDYMKGLLYVAVCPEAGHEVLNEAPHQMLEDIPIISRIMMVQDDDYTASVMVTDSMMDNWGISEETLFDSALP